MSIAAVDPPGSPASRLYGGVLRRRLGALTSAGDGEEAQRNEIEEADAAASVPFGDGCRGAVGDRRGGGCAQDERPTEGSTLGSCTSGFNWLIGASSVYATTAGHCGSGTYFNDGQVVGSTSALRRDTQTDAQIIPANVQGIIYNGGLDDFNHVIVGWYYTSQVTEAAYNVCAGGRNFGQRCGSRVYLTNQCITYAQGYTTCGQIIAQQSAGNFPGTFGDSGGPVYTSYSDGNAIARGLITGGYSPNLTLWSYAPVDRIQGGFGGAPLGFG